MMARDMDDRRVTGADRRRLVLGLALLVVAAATDELAAQQAPPTPADTVQPVFRRAQRLVSDGHGAEGRALVDSVLNATEPRSPEEAEALYWRATLAASWESAQRDYLRIMLEHERSPRAGDAMLRLAQGEVARNDREAAIRYLERLAREAPNAPARAEGALWHGRLLIEGGARNDGCAVLRGGRPLVRAGAIELENQYDYLLRACPDPAPAAQRPAPQPQQQAPRPQQPQPQAPTATGAWSVQVGAFSTAAEARAVVDRLKPRGYDARVDGNAAPFRVRFGRFATRAEAAAAAERYRTQERGDAFIVEVPRG